MKSFRALFVATAIAVVLNNPTAVHAESPECQALMRQYQALRADFAPREEQRRIYGQLADTLEERVDRLDDVIDDFQDERDDIQRRINRGEYAYYGMKAAGYYAAWHGLSMLRLSEWSYVAATSDVAIAGEWGALGAAWAGLGTIQLSGLSGKRLRNDARNALEEFDAALARLEDLRDQYASRQEHWADFHDRLDNDVLDHLVEQLEELEDQMDESCGPFGYFESDAMDWDLRKPEQPSGTQMFNWDIPEWARYAIVRIEHGYDDTGDLCAEVSASTDIAQGSMTACEQGWEELVLETGGQGKLVVTVSDHDTEIDGGYPGNGGTIQVVLDAMSQPADD